MLSFSPVTGSPLKWHQVNPYIDKPRSTQKGEKKEHYLDPGTRRVNLKQSALQVPGEAPEPAPSSQALLSFMLREDAHPPDAS